MPESKKEKFTKADFLTATKFAKKHSVSRELVYAAMGALYKRNKQMKNTNGVLTPVIIANRNAHDYHSRYLAHPSYHDIILNEVEKQQNFLNKRTQGTEK